MLVRGAHDERPNGLLCVLSDDGRLREGEGRGIRGWARGTEGLEGCHGEEVWPDKDAPKRGRGVDEGAKKGA